MGQVMCAVGSTPETIDVPCLRGVTYIVRISGENVGLCEYHVAAAVEILAGKGVNLPVLMRNDRLTVDDKIRRNWEDKVRHAY